MVFLHTSSAGIESFSKLGDSIYFEEEGSIPSLYIIQYISSTFDWKSGKIVLNQKVDPVVSWDPYLRVTLTSSSKEVPEATNLFYGPGRLHCIYIPVYVIIFTDTRNLLNATIKHGSFLLHLTLLFILLSLVRNG